MTPTEFLRESFRAIRLIPSEMELRLCHWIMRSHAGEQVDGGAWCLHFAHRVPQPWPCEDFMRADRAVDEVLERRN